MTVVNNYDGLQLEFVGGQLISALAYHSTPSSQILQQQHKLLLPIMEPSSGTDTTFHNHYFNDPTLSDLTIRLSDRTVHVHRIVLCRRSAYFEKLILGGFKVSTTGGGLAMILN